MDFRHIVGVSINVEIHIDIKDVFISIGFLDRYGNLEESILNLVAYRPIVFIWIE
jgi:hypothetical protein